MIQQQGTPLISNDVTLINLKLDNPSKCPNCNSYGFKTHDFDRGETYCTVCGYVHHNPTDIVHIIPYLEKEIKEYSTWTDNKFIDGDCMKTITLGYSKRRFSRV